MFHPVGCPGTLLFLLGSGETFVESTSLKWLGWRSLDMKSADGSLSCDSNGEARATNVLSGEQRMGLRFKQPLSHTVHAFEVALGAAIGPQGVVLADHSIRQPNCRGC